MGEIFFIVISGLIARECLRSRPKTAYYERFFRCDELYIAMCDRIDVNSAYAFLYVTPYDRHLYD
jgi:hypothetical protein